MNVGKLTNAEARVVAAMRALRRAGETYINDHVAQRMRGRDVRPEIAADLRAKRNELRDALAVATEHVL